MSNVNRRRVVYAAVVVAIVVLGLAIHLHGSFLNARIRDVAGDALWASMMAAGISALIPEQKSVTRYTSALCICYAVEFSQLWHTPGVDQFRATRLGALMLGSGFDWRDLVAYACGVLAFAWADTWLSRPKV